MEASCRSREGPTPFWWIPLLIQGGRKAQGLLVGLLPTSGFSCSPLLSPCSKIPYRLKEMDNEFDNFSQVPESPIGREEEPHLYRVAKKYRKVVVALGGSSGEHRGSHGGPWCGEVFVSPVTSLLRSPSNIPSWGWRILTSSITTRRCLRGWSPTFPTPTATA